MGCQELQSRLRRSRRRLQACLDQWFVLCVKRPNSRGALGKLGGGVRAVRDGGRCVEGEGDCHAPVLERDGDCA